MLPRFSTVAVLALLAAIRADVEERTNWLVLRDAYQDAGATPVEARHLVYLAVLPYWDARRMVLAVNAAQNVEAASSLLRHAIQYMTDCHQTRVPIIVVNDRIPPIRVTPSGVRVTRQCRPDFPRGRRTLPRAVNLPPVRSDTIFVGCAWVCRMLNRMYGTYAVVENFGSSKRLLSGSRNHIREGVSRG